VETIGALFIMSPRRHSYWYLMERSQTTISQPQVSQATDPRDAFVEAVLASRILLILIR